MRTRIAPEIEELMWTLAESRDPQALDEFGRRYPELIQELGKRLAMTAGLRGARVAGTVSSIPRFTMRHRPQPIWSRPLALAAAAVVLSGLAIASFTLTRDLSRPSPVVVVPKVEPVRQDPVVTQVPIPELPLRGRTAPSGTQNAPPPVVAEHMVPRTVEIASARFPEALERIGRETGLQISMPDLPPDLADIQIEVRYYNKSGMEMLADLGAKYGFTAFSQGGNKVLIVPAREGQGDTDASTGG